jgi:hypothetical protein
MPVAWPFVFPLSFAWIISAIHCTETGEGNCILIFFSKIHSFHPFENRGDFVRQTRFFASFFKNIFARILPVFPALIVQLSYVKILSVMQQQKYP